MHLGGLLSTQLKIRCRVLHDIMIKILFGYVYHEVGKEEHGTRDKESTWSSSCVFLFELVYRLAFL